MLYKHQQELIDRNPSRHLLLWETGTGKTLTGILWAMKNLAGSSKALVICPKMLRETWHRAIEKDGDPARFVIVTKEEFRRDWQRLPRYPVIVMDEIHHLAGHTSQMHKAAVKYIRHHQPPFLLGLTATPYSNPWNVYGLAHLMGRSIAWLTFRTHFFDEVFMGNRRIPVAKKGIEPELIEILHRFGSTQRLADCIDMPESVYETETFELTAEQKKLIKASYDVIPVVRFTREHQITGGTLKGDEYSTPIAIPCPKSDRLVELVTEHPRTIVACRYIHEMEMLAEKLKDIRPIHLISGQVKDRDAIIQSLKSSDSYCLIVQAACSEGWELPECPVTIFYSMDWQYKNRNQMEGRIRRITNPARRLYITLVVKDSADEAIAKAIERKSDFQAELYAREGLPE